MEIAGKEGEKKKLTKHASNDLHLHHLTKLALSKVSHISGTGCVSNQNKHKNKNWKEKKSLILNLKSSLGNCHRASDWMAGICACGAATGLDSFSCKKKRKKIRNANKRVKI